MSVAPRLRPSPALLLALIVAACGGDKADSGGPGGGSDGGADGGSDGGSDGGAEDADGDGVTADADCDDADAANFPGNPEVCDGGDNDCDGLVDDLDDSVDPATGVVFYTDADRDGAGVGEGSFSCQLPPDVSTVGGDCDDADPNNFPGNTEVCDGADNDCDALADDADDSLELSTATRSWPDADRDGFGDDAAPLTACTVPAGSVLVGGDCDDADPELNPDTLWYADADLDGYGDPGASTPSCLAPPGHSRAAGDCDDARDDLNPGEVEICGDGLDNDCDGGAGGCGPSGARAWADADLTLSHADGASYFGYDVQVVDLDGDGQDDLIASAYDAEPTSGVEPGQVYVAWGPIAGSLGFPADADLTLTGDAHGDNAGVVQRTGDLDGDGQLDLVVGAPDADPNGTGAGAAYVIYGPASGWASSDLGDLADALIFGATGDRIGADLSASGDHDGDGLADLLLGADQVDTGASNAGAVHLILGSGALGDGLATAAAATVFTGVGASDYLGDNRLIADAVDLDGDGLDEIVLASVSHDLPSSGVGSVWIFYGDAAGHGASVPVSDADARIYGDAAYDYLGEGVESLGDVDGDGLGDLGVGAYGRDQAASSAGAVYVIAGASRRTAGETGAGAASLFRVDGAAASDGVGEGLCGGDLDFDGQQDLIVGNDGHDSPATNAGLVAVFYGPLGSGGSATTAAGDLTLTGPEAQAYLGRQVRAGDLSGDGVDDLLGIAYGAETIAVVFGGGL